MFLVTYIIGAIPSGYWMGRLHGVDLTEHGSGSTGATNVLRLVGKWQAAVVLVFDILKGFLPIFYIKNYALDLLLVTGFENYILWFLLVLTFVPILAHSKSVFVAFKGGKSSATGLGVLVAINPLVALITASIWFTAVKLSNISSMGSIVCIPLVPVWLYVFGESLAMISFGFVAFVYIVLIKHRANIKRLLDGTEPRIGD